MNVNCFFFRQLIWLHYFFFSSFSILYSFALVKFIITSLLATKLSLFLRTLSTKALYFDSSHSYFRNVFILCLRKLRKATNCFPCVFLYVFNLIVLVLNIFHFSKKFFCKMIYTNNLFHTLASGNNSHWLVIEKKNGMFKQIVHF